jgi:hypothetical protein
MKSQKHNPSAKDPGALKNPDWSYWENLATVCMREALQLSLGFDPHSHIPATETDMGSREAYFKRLQIAKNNAFGAEWLVDRVVKEDGDISAEKTEVVLKRFATWIVNETTLVAFPNEFSRLAESAAVGKSTGLTPSKKYWTQRSAEEFILEKQAAGSDEAAGKLHGVSRQRYSEIYQKVTEREGK